MIGNGEGSRFASSGARLAKHVNAGQCAGNQSGLNCGGLDVSGMFQSRHHRLGKREILESGCGLHGRVGQVLFL